MVAVFEEAQTSRRLAEFPVVELVDGFEIAIEGEEEFWRGQRESDTFVSRMRTCQIGMFWFRGDSSDELL
jgi:hypothetical protein